MLGLKQHQNMRFGQKQDGEPLSHADEWDYVLLRPDLRGRTFGLARIISKVVRVRSYTKRSRKYNGYETVSRKYVRIQCRKCGFKKWINLQNLQRGLSKGCRQCLQPKRFPTWLYGRMENKRQLCQNPKSSGWKDYGGRGIEFRFQSTTEACLWIVQTIGLPKNRNMQIDRIDNEGHYEPGNIRWSTQRQNCCHTRRRLITPMVHKFRMLHPQVRYSDRTLWGLLANGLSVNQIVRRWNKFLRHGGDKREYGISSMPDHFIASRCKAF